MSLCNERIIATDGHPIKLAVTLRCRAWTCERCCESREEQLYAEIKAGRPNRHLILTDRRESGKTAENVCKNLSLALRRIIDHERRNNPTEAYEYFAVVERTRLGWPHLHVALRSPWIDQEWLSKWMQRHFNSPVVWIEKARSEGGLARYLAKYMSKDPQRIGTSKRYWQSKGYALETFEHAESVDTWRTRSETLEEWTRWQQRKGWHAVMLSEERAKATAPGSHDEGANA